MRMHESEVHGMQMHESNQRHLERIRNLERAASAERRAREQDQKAWYRAKISIRK